MQNNVDQTPPLALESNSEATPMMDLSILPSPLAHTQRPPFPAIRHGRGVQEKMKPTRFIVGKVTITERLNIKTERPYFELRYLDRETGKDVKRRVECSRKRVREIADNLTGLIYQGKGYLPKANHAPDIAKGMLEAIQLANTQKQTSKMRTNYAKAFVRWLSEQFPNVLTWDQLKPSMLQRYVVDLENKGRAFDTVRLSVAPIKLAWRHMADNCPDLVNQPPRIRLASPKRRGEIQCLRPAEVAALLDWLRARYPALWPMACLQVLAGLRMLEAAALRIQDVDLKAGTITIDKTAHHTPKTRDSYRTIPVCGEVLAALKVAIAEQKIRPVTGELFVNEDGKAWKKDALTRRWICALKNAAATPEVDRLRSNGRKLTRNKHGLSMPRLAEIPARKLRAAFVTMAGRLGAPRELVKAYIGHSSGDVIGIHYRLIELNELRTVSEVIEQWRDGALDFASRKECGNQVLEASAR